MTLLDAIEELLRPGGHYQPLRLRWGQFRGTLNERRCKTQRVVEQARNYRVPY